MQTLTYGNFEIFFATKSESLESKEEYIFWYYFD